MSELGIFLVGVAVTILTSVAVVLVGLSEAKDPAHSQPDDLTEWERAIVEPERQARLAQDGSGSPDTA